jgi:hypothetical protein
LGHHGDQRRLGIDAGPHALDAELNTTSISHALQRLLAHAEDFRRRRLGDEQGVGKRLIKQALGIAREVSAGGERHLLSPVVL